MANVRAPSPSQPRVCLCAWANLYAIRGTECVDARSFRPLPLVPAILRAARLRRLFDRCGRVRPHRSPLIGARCANFAHARSSTTGPQWVNALGIAVAVRLACWRVSYRPHKMIEKSLKII